MAGEHRGEEPVDERLQAVAGGGSRSVAQPLEPDGEALTLSLDQAVGVEHERVALPESVAVLAAGGDVDAERARAAVPQKTRLACSRHHERRWMAGACVRELPRGGVQLRIRHRR